MSGELLSAALGYAAMGWAVLPVHGIVGGRCTCQAGADCKQPGKHPAIARWQDRASADQEAIKRAWSANPSLNVGIATGSKSGFFVLDIDPRHGGDDSLAALEREHSPLPVDGLTAVTGSGGRHFCFTAIPGLGNRTNLRPGIDIRGDGGQIVAAPSRHASGGIYRWADGATVIRPAPAWLVDMVKPAPDGSAVATLPNVWRRLWCEGVPEGGRNDGLARMAGYLFRKKLDPIMVDDMIRMWNSTRLVPPLSEDEVSITIESVCKKEIQRRERASRR